jgi:hypothetical protein
MAEHQDSRRNPAVNTITATSPSQLLDFVEVGLAVVPRADLGAVEIRVRDARSLTTITITIT